MDAASNFIIEECASFLKSYLNAEIAIGSCGTNKVWTKWTLKMAEVN